MTGSAKKTLKQVKNNELRRYINNKMPKKPAFFPKSLAYEPGQKTSKQKNEVISVIFSSPSYMIV
jgi:hypothetical protein